MKQQDVTPAELAKKINVTVQAMYNILKRELLEPWRIEQISGALEHNFFQYVYLPSEEMQRKLESAEMQNLRKELEDAKKENAFFREIIEALKGNKK